MTVMNLRTFGYLSLLALLLTAAPAKGQNAPLDSLLKKFSHYREHALQEKIYAHIDQRFHLTGETLWFKLYTVDGAFHKPIDVSKVAYAEILDRADLPVLQAKIELNNGSGYGSFFLPASLSTGNYKLRVYTSWMKNFPPEFYYHQRLAIVNPFVIPEPISSRAVTTYALDFFPEGGNLVSGIKSKIAFKISGPSGQGVKGHGYIQNQRGDTVATFTSQKFGLGTFQMTPDREEKYQAVLFDPAGVKRIYPFAEVQATGYAMRLLDSAGVLRVGIEANGVSGGNVYLFAHARQIIASAQGGELRHLKAAFIVDKNDLADGISHFTVFDADMQPVCERLYFKYPEKELDIDITANQKIFSQRSRVSVSLQALATGKPSADTDLSMSVFKIDSLSTGNPTGIYPWLWLTSDLTGTVESPEYYFSERTEEATVAMDNLMLTHGWRRFEWNDVLTKEPAFTFLPEVREHIVTAVITEGDEPRRVFTYLGSPGKIIRAYGAWSDGNGEVRFEIKDFYGPRRIILQTKRDSTAMYQIKIRDPFSDQFEPSRLPAYALQPNLRNDILARSIAMQVQDIYYYDQFADRFVTPDVDSSAFYGKADATYLLDDYTRFPVMEEVMREYVPTVFVRKRRDGFHFLVVDQVNGGVLSGDPMILLDGVPLLDVDDIMKIDPLRVRKLDIINRQYYLGQALFPGIVSYTTYNGDLGGLELDPGSISLDYDGLQLRRKFHKPMYARERNDDRMPDQRHLLHWEPAILTDSNGKAQVEFYTSDVTGRFMIVVEGVNKSGFAGGGTYTFTVNPSENQ